MMEQTEEEKNYIEDRISDLKILKDTVKGLVKKLEDTIHTIDQLCKKFHNMIH